MRLAFFGSRTLTDNRAKALVFEAIEKYKPDVIVTAGEPEGICRISQQVSRELAIPLVLHWLNFKYLRGAFEHRSKAVILDCDVVIIIHDGISKGTANELAQVKKMKREYSYIKLQLEETPIPEIIK